MSDKTTPWHAGFLAAVRGDDAPPAASDEWLDGYKEGNRAACAIADGDFEDIEDEPPAGRTPQREWHYIKKDYGL